MQMPHMVELKWVVDIDEEKVGIVVQVGTSKVGTWGFRTFLGDQTNLKKFGSYTLYYSNSS